MKSTILFILTLYLSLNGFGQDYQKLIVDSRWNILLGGLIDCGFDCTDEDFRTHSLTISSDSIISDTIYSKLISTRYLSYDTTDFFTGLLREDTSEQKIYFRKPSDIERLIYDFSLSKGDTLKNFRYHDCGVCSKYAVVDSVDTITDLKGTVRQRFFIRDYYGIDTWIEGIGSTNGLVDIQHIDDTPNIEGLVCFWHSDKLTFEKEDNHFGCYYFSNITSIGEIYNNEKISVYPNPTNSLIQINSTIEIKNIKIFNMTGHIIYSTNPCSVNYSLNLSEFGSGPYILVIDSKRQIIVKE